MTSITKADLDKARDTLWDAGNLVEAIRRIAENMEDRGGDLDFVIQTVARIAKEKIHEVAGGVVLSPPPTKREIARATALLGPRGAVREQPKPEGEAALAKLIAQRASCLKSTRLSVWPACWCSSPGRWTLCERRHAGRPRPAVSQFEIWKP
jgi:hypothetical protein